MVLRDDEGEFAACWTALHQGLMRVDGGGGVGCRYGT